MRGAGEKGARRHLFSPTRCVKRLIIQFQRQNGKALENRRRVSGNGKCENAFSAEYYLPGDEARPTSRESVAGNARLEKNYIILAGAKSVARTTAERHRRGQCLEAYHDFNTRATPPRSHPRVKKGVSSQISNERGMHHAPPRYIIDFRESTAREQKKRCFSRTLLRAS